MSDKDFFLMASIVMIAPQAGGSGLVMAVVFFVLSFFCNDKP